MTRNYATNGGTSATKTINTIDMGVRADLTPTAVRSVKYAVGLISWYTGKIYGSIQYNSRAAEEYSIDTIKTVLVGVAVWMKGHIGIYRGLKNGVPYYIAKDGLAYGCREVPLSKNKFTHWFKISDICYEGKKETKDKDVVETIKRIRKLLLM